MKIHRAGIFAKLDKEAAKTNSVAAGSHEHTLMFIKFSQAGTSANLKRRQRLHIVPSNRPLFIIDTLEQCIESLNCQWVHKGLLQHTGIAKS